MTTILSQFRDRDLLEQSTARFERSESLGSKRVYLGFDPSADSLHLGNYQGIRALQILQTLGWTPVALIGGATGMIGDPSGKNHERPLLDPQKLKDNVAKITEQLKGLLKPDNGAAEPIFVNNADWLGKLNFIDCLRDVGKHFRVNSMIAKQSVRQRLESAEGISYTEFTYQVLQAFDFYHLHKELGVTLQIGGSDQWGNITAGCELVRKLSRAEVHGLTFPLLLQSDGKKFGKTERGAIWLSADKLSPFEFYQYLLRTPDRDIPMIMKRLTALDPPQIAKLTNRDLGAEGAKNAQRALASELTRDIHGEKGLQSALRGTLAISSGGDLQKKKLATAGADLPQMTLDLDQVMGIKIVELFALCKLTESRAEARRLIEGGGLTLNGEKVRDIHRSIEKADLAKEHFLDLGVGRKKRLILFLNDFKNHK